MTIPCSVGQARPVPTAAVVMVYVWENEPPLPQEAELGPTQGVGVPHEPTQLTAALATGVVGAAVGGAATWAGPLQQALKFDDAPSSQQNMPATPPAAWHAASHVVVPQPNCLPAAT